jgi:hypothetical protein
MGPYPAFKPDIGVLTSSGGALLSSPSLVTITWSGDPIGAVAVPFETELVASDEWGTLAQYGVKGATVSPAHVVVQEPPPAVWADTDLQSWLVTQLSSQAAGWPQPNANTMYVAYTPPSTQITTQGSDACMTNTSEHVRLPVGSNPAVSFVLVFGSCNWSGLIQDSDTAGAAVTIAGAATDPDSETWDSYDNAHYAWELFVNGASEVGDVCANYADDYFRIGPYAVARLWSNAAARGGHDPCAPAEPGPYYNVTPLAMKDMTVTLGSSGVFTQTLTTKGYRIAPGASGTFQVGLYSDGPTAPWSVRAVEGDGMNPVASPVLEISTDASAGSNGAVVDVTVKVKAAPAGLTSELMTVISTLNQNPHYMPILIGTF